MDDLDAWRSVIFPYLCRAFLFKAPSAENTENKLVGFFVITKNLYIFAEPTGNRGPRTEDEGGIYIESVYLRSFLTT